MRLVLLLALCNCVTYPQIYALDCCEWSEKSGLRCEIRSPDDELMSRSSHGRIMKHFNGFQVARSQAISANATRIVTYMTFWGICMPKLNSEE
ncbi:MAG: hypothetical protein MHMPM18_002849 [Marteilia pararefringens]